MEYMEHIAFIMAWFGPNFTLASKKTAELCWYCKKEQKVSQLKEKKTNLRIWPAERSLICEETERGRPFFSQWSCGGGVPVAAHSIFREVSKRAVSSSASSLLLAIVGGTAFCNDGKECIKTGSWNHFTLQDILPIMPHWQFTKRILFLVE